MAGALDVPAGKTTRRVIAENTQMRVLALLNQTLDELDNRRKQGKGDFVGKLATQLIEDPKAGMAAMLDWLGRVAPADAGPAAGDAGQFAFNIKELYLNAIQTANGHAPRMAGPQVVEHVPGQGTIGVHDEATDW